MRFPDPVEERIGGEQGPRAEAARDHDDLRMRHRGQRLVRHHGELAVVGLVRPGLDGHESHARPGQPREDFIGPDGVERGDPFEDRNGDVHASLLEGDCFAVAAPHDTAAPRRGAKTSIRECQHRDVERPGGGNQPHGSFAHPRARHAASMPASERDRNANAVTISAIRGRRRHPRPPSRSPKCRGAGGPVRPVSPALTTRSGSANPGPSSPSTPGDCDARRAASRSRAPRADSDRTPARS